MIALVSDGDVVQVSVEVGGLGVVPGTEFEKNQNVRN